MFASCVVAQGTVVSSEGCVFALDDGTGVLQVYHIPTRLSSIFTTQYV